MLPPFLQHIGQPLRTDIAVPPDYVNTAAPGQQSNIALGQLIDHVHADYRDVSDRSIDSHIRNLRRKLDPTGVGHDWVRSVYGVGYAFSERDSS